LKNPITPTREMLPAISDELFLNSNFPNCTGDIDGKYVTEMYFKLEKLV
jgi:hypothetical protein